MRSDRSRKGQTLVATLIVIVIIAMLAVVFMTGSLSGGKSSRKDGLGKTIPGAVKLAARDDVCRSNLGQARLAIQVARSNADDAPPATLEETKLSKDFLTCPIGKEAYTYDAQTGEVHCPHPGHEKY